MSMLKDLPGANPKPANISFSCLAVNEVFKLPITTVEYPVEKFLPEESNSTTYFVVAGLVAYSGNNQLKLNTAFVESEGKDKTIFVEDESKVALPLL